MATWELPTLLTKMRFPIDMNIIITPFRCCQGRIYIGYRNRLSESVIRLGSVIALGRLRFQNMSDVIVQFPLIAYGRMFTPDWEDVLNFHIICCCMIRPVSQYGNCYLFPIKGIGRMQFILLFCNLGIYRGHGPLHDKKDNHPEPNSLSF